MPTSSAEPHLAAIPETRPISDLPGSALASPRSTSDSPGRASAPISPTSRLLRPTLSWQAKAGWIPEAPAASHTTLTSNDSDVSSSQMPKPTAALSAPEEATTAPGRLSPSISATWQSTPSPLQPFQGNARNTMMATTQTQQPSHSLAAQQKVDQLTPLVQRELARHGQPSAMPWQQRRLQLRSVGSPAAGSGSPGHFRHADASVDTLHQQRAKLKPVQTIKHAPLPATAPLALAPLGAVHLRGVHPGIAAQPAAATGTAPAAKSQAAAPAGQNTAARAQLGPAQQVASPASQLRTKYMQLTDLLQSTALQRGISLSQVPIPATHNKPGKAQQKRVSLEEVRTSFRSFSTASSAAGSKPAPLRRVSTGAITPAFLKKKDKQDQELLEALSEVDAAAVATAPTWAPNPHGKPDLVDATPAAVFTRGKGYGRPTGNSFDIKLLATQDEVCSSAEADMTDPNIGGAAQAVAQVPNSSAGQSVGGHAARDSAVHRLSHQHKGGAAVGQTAVTQFAASKDRQLQPSKATQLQMHDERTGDSQVAGMVVKDHGLLPAQVQQGAPLDDIKVPQMTDTTDDNGINSSSVTVDIMLAQHTMDMTKDAKNTSQQPSDAQKAPKSEVGHKSSRGFGQRICCFCFSTKE